MSAQTSTAPPEGFTLGPPPARGLPLPEVVILMGSGEWVPVRVALSPGSQRKLRMYLPGQSQSVSVRAGRPEHIAWKAAR